MLRCRKGFVNGSPVQLFSIFPCLGLLPWIAAPGLSLLPLSILQALALNCPYSSLSSLTPPWLSLSFLAVPFIPYPPEGRTGTWSFIQGWRPRAEDTWTEDSENSQSMQTALDKTPAFLSAHRLGHLSEGKLALTTGLPCLRPGAPCQALLRHPPLPVISQLSIDRHLFIYFSYKIFGCIGSSLLRAGFL